MNKVFTILAMTVFGNLIAEENIDKKIEIIQNDVSICRQALQEYTENDERVLKEFDETVLNWANYAQNHPHFNLHKLLDGVAFAAKKHQGQYRLQEGHIPYIIHPIGVAKSLWAEGGIRSVNILIAALLHDTLEDTATTPDEIEAAFGSRVRLTVEEVTDDPNLSSSQNKQRQIDHAPEMTHDAQLVKLSDRLYNIRDFVPLINSDVRPAGITDEMIRGYMMFSQKLVKALQGTNEEMEQKLVKEIELRIIDLDNRKK